MNRGVLSTRRFVTVDLVIGQLTQRALMNFHRRARAGLLAAAGSVYAWMAVGLCGCTSNDGAVRLADGPEVNTPRAGAPGDHLRDRVIRELSFDDVPVSEALASVLSIVSCRLELDWPMLNARGFRADRPVTVKLRNVKCVQALTVLAAAAAEEPFRPEWIAAADGCSFKLIDGRDRSFYQEQRYDVRDLCIPIDSEATRQFVEAVIIDFVVGSTGADEWPSTRSQGGVVAFDGQFLIVCASPGTHMRVADLLRLLRKRPSLRFGAGFGCFYNN